MTASLRRGVPDVAAAAAGTSRLSHRPQWHGEVKDGTSAVDPLWAGLIAIANAARGTPLGFVNSALYANPAAVPPDRSGQQSRRAAKGYDAGAGWNACTGLGVPKGADIIAALAATPRLA